MMEYMPSLHLRFEVGETLPEAGETIYAHGLAGTYQVKIQKVLSRRKLQKDGATVLVVRAKRQLVENA